MSDQLLASYESVPYRHGAVPGSHPARIGAIGALFGLATARPDRCRVLELGCAVGMNLLPVAERFPHSRFVGVDFASAHIGSAEAFRQECGLANVELTQADLREYQPEAGAFDYVIAHGVYSWVPAPVRERLMEIAAKALAPAGLAYISYNTLPGWGLLGSIRSILLKEIASESNPAERMRRGGQLLKALESALVGEPGAYGHLLRDLVAEMRAKPPELLLHDELSEVNEPCTFVDFVEHSRRFGLNFLAEAHLASMPLDHLRPAASQALAGLDLDFIHAQQMLDLLGNRHFRASLLVREAIAPEQPLSTTAVRDCVLSSYLRLESPLVNLHPGSSLKVVGRHGVTFTVSDPAQKAFLAALIASAPERIPFLEAVAQARRHLQQAGITATIDEDLLCHAVVRLFTVDQVDLLLASEEVWPPDPTPLMRMQAREKFPVVNRWHEVLDADACTLLG